MVFSLLALSWMLLAGIGSLAICRWPAPSRALGVAGAALGSIFGLIGAVRAVVYEAPGAFELPWGGYGTLGFSLDPMSGLFLAPLWALAGAGAVYGHDYLDLHLAHEPARATRRPLAHWFFYDLLVAAMAAVFLAANVLTFLLAWEVMALASAMLVLLEAEKPEVREAGWIYLVATHLGTAFIFAVLLIVGDRAGSFEFSAMRQASLSPEIATVLFVLAVIGFGAKAGFVPLHVWLPEAHPAAPSHVSALMSGVMVKTGLYGLLRTLTFLGAPQVSWGYILITVGVGSGILGALFALAQHDLKRLLAYCTVENVGVMTIGLGLGVLGVASGSEPLAVLGLGGALFHVVNHALAKGLLFFGAGSVAVGTGSRDLDKLGGLSRKMPVTAALFLVGAVSIAALPPFNGFASEFVLYLGALSEAGSPSVALAGPAAAAVAALALIGGLTLACFASAFGMVFLGTARTPAAQQAREVPARMRAATALLALACVVMGGASPFIVPLLGRAVSVALLGAPLSERPLVLAAGSLGVAIGVCFGLMALLLVLGLLRRSMLSARDVRLAPTWDCGYVASSARIQYTSSSFTAPLTRAFSVFLRTRRAAFDPTGYFPTTASLSTETPDLGHERIFAPAFAAIREGLGRMRWLQGGDVHLYVLYVAATLILLLLWKV